MAVGDLVIEPYKESDAEEWDAVVKASRNGTFLLQRKYMDYHADRFVDQSLIVRGKSGEVVGLMAAAVPVGADNETVTAHPGLTYGGLILPYRTDSIEVVEMMEAAVEYYKRAGFKYLRYRPVPHIYHRYPSEDDVYALIRRGAVVDECLLSSTIRLNADRPKLTQNTRRNIAKASKNGVTYRQCESEAELRDYYQLLEATLVSRHAVKPVHSFDELNLLISKFPDNIKTWVALSPENEIVAGVVMYLTDMCAHAQYIAASPKGFKTSALTGLIEHLIETYSNNHQFFDFGNSNEAHGLILNNGLIRQKSGFGARGTTAMTLLLKL